MPRVYRCDCRAKCKGEPRQVSKATFFGHAPYCVPNSRFSARLQDIFRSNPIVHGVSPNALEGSRSSSGAIGPPGGSVPRTEQTCTDDRNQESVSPAANPP